MPEKSKIEWTESTWNPVTGCTKISKGCLNCYAEKMAKRLAGRYGYPKEKPFKVTLHPDRLKQPLGWKKNHIIFVCSMSDLFHEDIPDEYLRRVIDMIKECSQHTFQILTKRADNLLRISATIGEWPENAWIGVTVEASEYLHRMDVLREIKAGVKFLSCEPLLDDLGALDLTGIDWVIAGGESGHGARLVSAKWAGSLRDQCLKSNTPFFFKQWGGFRKKENGRLLDGVEWNQMPDAAAAGAYRTEQAYRKVS